MALGSHVPEWKALKAELEALATESNAHLAAVISTGNVLWCASRLWDDVNTLADTLYHEHLAPLRQGMRRGVGIDVVVKCGDDVCVIRSFASIYVVALWIRGDLDIVAVRAAIRNALPRIETLTTSLPPPNPEPAEGAGKSRA